MYGQYDMRPRWSYGSAEDNDLEIAFDKESAGYQTGRAFLWPELTPA